MFLQADVDKYNEQVKAWTDETKALLVSTADSLGVKHARNSQDSVSLQRSIKGRTSQQTGVTNKVSFTFNRSMVWLQKGVSRGHPKTNPRQIKDVFNGPLEKQLEILADIVADAQGDMIINSLLIK
jgi:hypothetical protein